MRLWPRDCQRGPAGAAPMSRATPDRYTQALVMVLVGTWILPVQAADLQDLHPECLKPCEQPVQSRLISDRAVYDSLDRFDRGRKPVEVEQRLGRKNSRYPDLVVRRRHRCP
jgi:hypothetical protein